MREAIRHPGEKVSLIKQGSGEKQSVEAQRRHAWEQRYHTMGWGMGTGMWDSESLSYPYYEVSGHTE